MLRDLISQYYCQACYCDVTEHRVTLTVLLTDLSTCCLLRELIVCSNRGLYTFNDPLKQTPENLYCTY